MRESLSNKLNTSTLVEKPDCIEFSVIALTPCTVKRPYGDLTFPADELQKSSTIESLAEIPFKDNHLEGISNTIGITIGSSWSPDDIGAVTTARIPRLGNDRIVSLAIQKPTPLKHISSTVDFDKIKTGERTYLARNIKFVEVSLVDESADKNSRTKLSKNNSDSEEDHDMAETKTAEQLTADLTRTQESLQAEKTRNEVMTRELEQLKADAAIGKKYQEQLKADAKKGIIVVEGEKSPLLLVLDSAPIETLESLSASYTEKAKEALKQTAKTGTGDPSGGDATPDKQLTTESMSKMSYQEILAAEKRFQEAV